MGRQVESRNGDYTRDLQTLAKFKRAVAIDPIVSVEWRAKTIAKLDELMTLFISAA